MCVKHIWYLLTEFAADKPLLVFMDDGLAIITSSVGACPDLPLLVLHPEAWIDASNSGTVSKSDHISIQNIMQSFSEI